MVYRLAYSVIAQRHLRNLPKKEAVKILKKLSSYAHNPHPLRPAKKLKGLKEAHYRYRIGDYRAIFRVDPKTKRLVLLVILKIVHRKDAY